MIFCQAAKLVIEPIILGSFELTLAEILRVQECFTEVGFGLFASSFCHGSICQAHQRILILLRNLTLAAFPWMETMCSNRLICVLIATDHVQHRDVFDVERITKGQELRRFFHKAKSLVKREADAAVELVSLHEDADVRTVLVEGSLDHLSGTHHVTALVRIELRQIPRHGREARIRCIRSLPECLRLFPAETIVEEVTKIILRLRPIGSLDREAQDRNILKRIREAVGRIDRFGFDQYV